MLATTPIDPHQLIRFDTLVPYGPHSAWPRRTERRSLPVGRFLAVGALVLAAYVVAGTLAADAVAPVPAPVASPAVGDVRLGPGNATPPGAVTGAEGIHLMPGDFRLGPGDGTPPGVAPTQ